MDYKCKYCLIKSSENLVDNIQLEKEEKETLVNELFSCVSTINSDLLTPEAARKLHKIITEKIDFFDPCLSEKKKSNDLALQQYENFKEKVLNSDNSFDTALRLSIAGNIMDFAAFPEFFDDAEKHFKDTVDKVLFSDFAVNDSLLLEKKVQEANTVLFLGDNAGEIVTDKLFLETIKHPNVYYAVRGKPVMNDATIEDAEYVKIGQFAKVISNGYDAPSTIIDKCSDEFMKVFNKADLIISKGQGNLEGLMNINDDRIFFLLMVKCNVIAKQLKVSKGDFVVIQNT